jgi:hypothetical protein
MLETSGDRGQLRRDGYRLEQIAPLIAYVRSAASFAPPRIDAARLARSPRARSRAMLTGAAALDAYLTV